jgi:transposase
MAGPRRKFSREYKLAAIAPVIERLKSGSEVARELGISPTLVARWRLEFEASETQSFPGNGNLSPEAAETARLKRENERLRGELEILKKRYPSSGRGRSEVRLHAQAARALAAELDVRGARGLAQRLLRFPQAAAKPTPM